MTQYVVTLADGRMYGIVLDDSPMTDAQVSRHVESFGARLPGDLVAWARYVSGRQAWTLTEVVGRDRSFSGAGRARRRYPAASRCRVVASSATTAAEAA